jgi:hypothetical protein
LEPETEIDQGILLTREREVAGFLTTIRLNTGCWR